MAASVDVESEIVDTGKVRLFVLALTDADLPLVEAATAALKAYSEFPVEELPLGMTELNSIPFKDSAWLDCGRIRTSAVHLSAPRGKDWEVFQPHRKAFAALAIGEGGGGQRNADVKKLMVEALASHGLKDVPVQRCLLFDSEDSKEKVEEWLLRLSPAQRGREQFRFISQQIAAAVVREIMSVLAKGASGQPDTVVTPADTIGSKVEDSKRFKAKTEARSKKIIADYLLLGGSAVEASNEYSAALEISRNNSDHLCTASCLEGLACARLIVQENFGAEVDAGQIDRWMEEAVEEYREHHKKKAAPLYVEAAFKLARFRKSVRQSGDGKRILDSLSTIVTSSSDYLSQQNRIAVLGKCASLCAQLGLMRKAGFYLRETAQLYGLLQYWGAAHHLFLSAASLAYRLGDVATCLRDLDEHYGVAGLATAGKARGGGNISGVGMSSHVATPTAIFTTVKQRRRGEESGDAAPSTLLGGRNDGWGHLQRSLLIDLRDSARKMGDSEMALRYALAGLRYVSTSPPADQYAFLSSLLELAPRVKHGDGVVVLPGGSVGLADVMKVVAQPLVPSRKVTERPLERTDSSSGDAGGGPFLFCAFRSGDEKKGGKADVPSAVQWVAGEESHIHITLRNPFVFPLPVEKIGVMTVGDVSLTLRHSTSVRIPPSTSNFVVSLPFKALRPGKVGVVAVVMQTFGVETRHVISEMGAETELEITSDTLQSAKRRAEEGKGAGTIEVLPPMPLLQSELDVSWARGVMSGQKSEGSIVVRNMGSATLSEMSAHIVPGSGSGGGGGGDGEEIDISIDEEGMKQALPLQPGASMRMKIRMVARRSWSGAVNIKYGDGERRTREAKVPLHVEVHEGVSVTDVCVIGDDTSKPHEGHDKEWRSGKKMCEFEVVDRHRCLVLSLCNTRPHSMCVSAVSSIDYVKAGIGATSTSRVVVKVARTGKADVLEAKLAEINRYRNDKKKRGVLASMPSLSEMGADVNVYWSEEGVQQQRAKAVDASESERGEVGEREGFEGIVPLVVPLPEKVARALCPSSLSLEVVARSEEGKGGDIDGTNGDKRRMKAGQAVLCTVLVVNNSLPAGCDCTLHLSSSNDGVAIVCGSNRRLVEVGETGSKVEVEVEVFALNKGTAALEVSGEIHFPPSHPANEGGQETESSGDEVGSGEDEQVDEEEQSEEEREKKEEEKLKARRKTTCFRLLDPFHFIFE